MVQTQRKLGALAAALFVALACALVAALPQAAFAVETNITAGTTAAKATTLQLKGKGLSSTNYATFNTTNDNNWYKITTSNRNSKYKITIKADSNDTIFFTIYDSGMHRFYSSYLETSKKLTVTLDKLKRNSLYYIEVWRYAVDSPYISNVPYADYRITAKEVITPPKKVTGLKVSSPSSYKLNVKYQRSFYANGYQICIKRTWETGKKQGFYFFKTKDLDYTRKVLFHDSTHKYRVKVRPYRVVNDVTYYGKWCKWSDKVTVK